jgi:hypothetical protein
MSPFAKMKQDLGSAYSCIFRGEASVDARTKSVLISALLLVGTSGVSFADECSAILEQGVFNTYQGLRTRDLRTGFQQSFCQSSSSSSGGSTGAGLNVMVPIYGVPVKFGGDYKQTSSSLSQQGSCSNSASSLSDATYENILQKVVAPEIVAAWTDCRTKAGGGLFINGDLNGDTLVLEFRFRPMGVISRTTLTEDPRITGASCPRPIVKARTVLNNAPKYEQCQRSGTGAVTVIANSTNDGARFFIPAVAPPPPPPPDVPQVLEGSYQVRLGPGGGCNGGPPNSFPQTLAKITIDNVGAVWATNECAQTSRLSVVDNGHGYWWGQPISFDLRNGGVTISEDRRGGNSWQKVQR